MTQYLQATSRLQTWWGANSHVLPLGGPANIKGDALQSWYFLTLPAVSAAAAVNVNSESKRGTGELKLRWPPPPPRTGKSWGVKERDGGKAGVEIKKERWKDEQAMRGRNPVSLLPNARLPSQQAKWGMAHHSRFLSGNQVMDQRYHLEWS